MTIRDAVMIKNKLIILIYINKFTKCLYTCEYKRTNVKNPYCFVNFPLLYSIKIITVLTCNVYCVPLTSVVLFINSTPIV